MFNKKEYMKNWQKNHSKKLKEYQKEYDKQYYIKNSKEILRYKKQHREDNIDRFKTKDKNHYIENREEILKRQKQWNKNHSEQVNKYNKEYYIENKEKILEQNKHYYETHLKERSQYQIKKYKTDIRFNLSKRIARAMRTSLKDNKKSKHWEILVGYTYKNLLERLKKTMPVGYNWNDYLNGKLHIDHIIPVTAFNFTKSEHIDFARCWALNNLRLLPAKENIIKSNILVKPFQPALQI